MPAEAEFEPSPASTPLPAPTRGGGADRPVVLSPAARALADRCQSRVNELARTMTRDTFERLPGYPDLPAEVKDVEIAATVRGGLRTFLRRVHDAYDEPDDYRLFRERAAQRAEEGLPLHLLLRTHTVAAQALWRVLREETVPGEEGALLEIVDLLLWGLDSVVATVAETYLDELAALAAESHERRRSLVRGLLDGSVPPGRAFDELGLAGRSVVLRLHMPAEPTVRASPVAVRRRVRRTQIVLDRALGPHAALLACETGTVVASRRAADSEAGSGWEDLRGRLGEVCGEEVRLAVVAADAPSDVPDAARTAADLVRLARAGGRVPGVHRLEDFLLEIHLTRRSEASEPIRALLDPIASRPELLETLRVHLEHRSDRRAGARVLGVHPNTVDNRLARIAELTGLDLATPRGGSLALAALLLREGAPRPPRQGGGGGPAG
ncbi:MULTISPECIES: PucR family transcriptional regulator [unclassified Streptomyces]|uniref:PucR family transcriptional regulator n=1 Tax=unclassified Streptomyces TaxID=2593676 RepID=UPI001F5B0CD7|nr:helix-turn-helix domain-containing protein [Streptomyces sp. HSG2]